MVCTCHDDKYQDRDVDSEVLFSCHRSIHMSEELDLYLLLDSYACHNSSNIEAEAHYIHSYIVDTSNYKYE